MSQIKVYGLSKCSTCQKAQAWLDQHGVDYAFVDYREHPIGATDLASYAEQLTWEKLVNRASMTWRGLPEARKQPADEAQWQALVAEFPALIKRPLLVRDGVATAGFSDKRYAALFA
ncbi:MAG: Spx/MgsR family RNA polymerase-binding regulatory protein [Xanthomonadales bacterium]|nr:Spx/MgsR family RNA polymerase-binding regulatory protein [Xanthomonadales bacterium]